MKRILSYISVLLVTLSCAGSISVKEFGATGDGVTLDTQAVQAAIDRAAEKGGGTVRVPAGTYLCGSIWLRSNVHLHLDEGAVIKGSPDIDDYCGPDCCPQNEAEVGFGDYISGGHLILGVGVVNVTLSGPGKIDGNSDAFLLDAEGRRYAKKSLIPARPSQMVWFVDSREIVLKDLELADSPYWSCFILNCDNVTVDGCYVHTRRKDYHTFNGDGIDIDRSTHVKVTNCRVDTSDDSITLRASCGHLLENPQDCAWVSVENCELSSSCNAIRVGVGEGHIHDAVLNNLTISDTNIAFSVVGAYSKNETGPDIDNILFRDIKVKASELLRIHHMRSQSCSIHDITFDSVSGEAPNLCRLWAREAAPFENIVFRDVDVQAEYERVNAEVVVEGGLLTEKVLSPEERELRRTYIEEEKKLLY